MEAAAFHQLPEAWTLPWVLLRPADQEGVGLCLFIYNLTEASVPKTVTLFFFFFPSVKDR